MPRGARRMSGGRVSLPLHGRSGGIRTIQRGTIAIVATASSGTATITSVDTSQSTARHLGTSSPEADANQQDRINGRMVLTNATTVTVTQGNTVGAGDTSTSAYEVVERWPGSYRSIQRGTLQVTNTNSTVDGTVTAVDTDHAQLFLQGRSGTNIGNNTSARMHLEDTTTVRGTRSGTSGSSDILSYELLEEYSL